MARTEHLPLYKSAYDLCLYLEQVVRNFSRYHKAGRFIEFYGPQRFFGYAGA